MLTQDHSNQFRFVSLFSFTTQVQQHKFLKDDIDKIILLSSLIFFSLNVEECSHWKKILSIKIYFLKGFIRFLFLAIFPWANFVGSPGL